jgi:hypothetical protein
MDVTAYRILVWRPVEMMWRQVATPATWPEAKQCAESWQQLGLKVRIRDRTMPLPVDPKPAVNNETRAWREEQLQKQIELADANKRYKSPG